MELQLGGIGQDRRVGRDGPVVAHGEAAGDVNIVACVIFLERLDTEFRGQRQDVVLCRPDERAA